MLEGSILRSTSGGLIHSSPLEARYPAIIAGTQGTLVTLDRVLEPRDLWPRVLCFNSTVGFILLLELAAAC